MNELKTVDLHSIMFRKAVVTQSPEFNNSYILSNVRAIKQMEDYGSMFSIALATEFLAERTDRKTFSFPYYVHKSWWQHFKDDCFPKWLKERFPVKMEIKIQKEDLSAWEVYPLYPIFDREKTKKHFTIVLKSGAEG